MRSTLSRIFAIPALLGLLQAVGLVSALLGDGLLDVLSWLTLGAAAAVAAHYGLRRGREARPAP